MADFALSVRLNTATTLPDVTAAYVLTTLAQAEDQKNRSGTRPPNTLPVSHGREMTGELVPSSLKTP
jgi:hypothetical protein